MVPCPLIIHDEVVDCEVFEFLVLRHDDLVHNLLDILPFLVQGSGDTTQERGDELVFPTVLEEVSG